MTTYQFFTTAPGALQSRAYLSKTSCTRMNRLSLLSPAGRDGRASASEGKGVGLGRGEGSFGHLGGASFKPLTSILSSAPPGRDPGGEATETD